MSIKDSFKSPPPIEEKDDGNVLVVRKIVHYSYIVLLLLPALLGKIPLFISVIFSVMIFFGGKGMLKQKLYFKDYVFIFLKIFGIGMLLSILLFTFMLLFPDKSDIVFFTLWR